MRNWPASDAVSSPPLSASSSADSYLGPGTVGDSVGMLFRIGCAWRTARSEHGKTESPNAGWPIAAMAGALNVRLEKPGHYRLGAPGAALKPGTINESLKLLTVAALGWIMLCFMVGVTGIAFAF